ncbi:hypothetical protein AVEN_149517-1 [Araneus ventricosus]|uniref:Uncharacterized protein n=1 Tax=Araneus ventricosus TaxID=182803 RepID=A0A4Y2KA18_ARAVE|nr:hypothetical protein AVEN_149517-1 [Araneus ventricosus]
MKLVFRRPDMKSQRPKSILLPPRKSSPCSSLSSSEDLFQKSLRSLPSHFLLTPSSSSWGKGPEKSLQQITVNSVGGVHLREPLLAHNLFWACPFVASGFSDWR